MLSTLALLLVQAPQTAPPANLARVQEAPVQALVRVAPGVLTAEHVRTLDLDVACHASAHGVDVIADADHQAAMRDAGIPFEVVHEDLTAFYAARLAGSERLGAPAHGAWLSPVFGDGAMGGYYTWAEVVSVLDQIHAAYPALTTARFSIGTTIEGRDIWAMKVSDNPGTDEGEPEVRFDAMHHAREPQSMQTTLWLMLSLLEGYGTDPVATWMVNEREMWFIPVVNADGYVHNQSIAPGGGGLWRKNRRNNGNGTFGVDPNRNYSYEWGFDDDGSSPVPSSETYRGTGPASEPEIQAMQAFIDARDFRTAVSAHTYSNLWLWPWGYVAAAPANAAEYDELGALCIQENGYLAGPAGAVLYLANGGTFDYDHGVHGTMGFTPEIGGDGDGFWPATSRIVPLAELNRLAFLRVAWAAGAFVHATDVALGEVGDGDGGFEPGESVQVVLDLRNSGRDASGTVEVSLASPTPGIGVTTSTASLGTLASFSGTDNAGSPLVLSIGAGVAEGTRVDYVVTLSYEGLDQELPGSFVVGTPRLVLTDDLETDVGWTVGAPGDGATTGIWEHGDPVGTTSNGAPSNPEDDATASGTLCYTTGNGSTTAGGDDVDGGPTTLTSPRMDLSGVSMATLRLQRWFTNFTSQNDSLDILLSDDDGASWTTVETITGQASNAWLESAVEVQDHVALTDRVRLRLVTGDSPNDSLTEAAVDDVEVLTYTSQPKLVFYGTPAIGGELVMHVAADAGERWALLGSTAPGATLLPGGTLAGALRGPVLRIAGGTIPAGGLARVTVAIPDNPALVGMDLGLRAVVLGESPGFSNRATLTFE